MLVRRDLIAACTFLLFKGPQTKSRHSRGERGEEGVTGMRIVSLWGVNYIFWSHLGCLGRKDTIFARFRYRLGLCVKIITKNVDTNHTELPLGVSLNLSHTHLDLPVGISFEFSDERPHHFYIAVSPPPLPVRHSTTERKGKRSFNCY